MRTTLTKGEKIVTWWLIMAWIIVGLVNTLELAFVFGFIYALFSELEWFVDG